MTFLFWDYPKWTLSIIPWHVCRSWEWLMIKHPNTLEVVFYNHRTPLCIKMNYFWWCNGLIFYVVGIVMAMTFFLIIFELLASQYTSMEWWYIYFLRLYESNIDLLCGCAGNKVYCQWTLMEAIWGILWRTTCSLRTTSPETQTILSWRVQIKCFSRRCVYGCE